MDAQQKKPASEIIGHGKIKKLHHHAVKSRDIEKTRFFYEDVLGLPLIATFVESDNMTYPDIPNYIHTFFELGDGSCLAFFQFPPGTESANENAPVDVFSHHIAIEVDGKEAIDAIQARYNEFSIEYILMDHGYCYSIYTRDPNEMTLEFTTRVPNTAQIMKERRATAHQDLKNWLSGVYKNNNTWRRGKTVKDGSQNLLTKKHKPRPIRY